MDALIHQLEQHQDLTASEVAETAEWLLELTVTDEKKQALLEALALKGETAGEIAGFVEAFLRHAVDPELGQLELQGPTLDVCGTGGDQLDLFNVSTTAMFIAAAAGAVVVKHGNRGITSKSGGADVLEALGIRIDLPAAEFRRCVQQAGLGFMFAPMYHPAFKAVGAVRKSLAARGVKTIFNLIGPLLNPARPQCQLVGVFAPDLCPIFADILQRLGRESAWVVHGRTGDGRAVDEVSLMGSTRIYKAGRLRDFTTEEITPEALGFESAEVEALQGGDAKVNALILEAILSGRETGPKRDMVILNSAAALACSGLASDLKTGLEISREMITSGAAQERLRLLQKSSRA